MNKILEYFDLVIPNPSCELNYNNDFELLIAIVLSAQTTDKRVNKVTKMLFNKYPTAVELSKAKVEDIENIIKSIGTYKKKSIYIINIAKILVINNKIAVPKNRKFLEKLPGVGQKTINVFLSEINNEDLIAVDTHVTRVSKRLNLVKNNDNVLTIEKKLQDITPVGRGRRTHLQFVLFGRYFCKAKNPQCKDCQLQTICTYYKVKNKD